MQTQPGTDPPPPGTTVAGQPATPCSQPGAAPATPPPQYGAVYSQAGQQYDPGVVLVHPYPPPPYESCRKTGMAPRQHGMYPGQAGMYPGQPGMYAGQPGMYPGQAGMTPGQPEMALGVITCQQALNTGQHNWQPPQSFPNEQRPNDYLVPSIMSMFFCCCPLGMIATCFACQSKEYFDRREFLAAKDSSRKAKYCMVSAIICGLLVFILRIAIAILDTNNQLQTATQLPESNMSYMYMA